MGQTGFLRKSAVSCENLRPQNAVIPRISENQQKSAKISKKLRICAFVPFSLSLLFPLALSIECQIFWRAVLFCRRAALAKGLMSRTPELTKFSSP